MIVDFKFPSLSQESTEPCLHDVLGQTTIYSRLLYENMLEEGVEGCWPKLKEKWGGGGVGCYEGRQVTLEVEEAISSSYPSSNKHQDTTHHAAVV